MPSVTATATPAALTPRRRELLEAALHVVADDGLRGLTHRAVDRRAGLPEGTTSAYLRTRQALQLAVTEYVAATLAADVDRLGADLAECDGDETQALPATLALFERWLDDRELILAKLELSMEAPRNPAVAEVLAAWRSRLVGVVDGILAPSGQGAQPAAGGGAGRVVRRSPDRGDAEAPGRAAGLPVGVARP